MMNTSLYMIKPEAMNSRNEIRDRIKNELAVVAIKTILLPSWVIDELYTDLNDSLRNATNIALSDPVELGIVQGDHAVERLLDIAGKNTKPSECHSTTIRYQYGKWDPILVGGVAYYMNAIHRPKNDEEANAHISLFDRIEP